MPAPLRYSTDARTLTVLDTHTGEHYPCADLMSMMKRRTELELAAMPAKATSARKQQRIEASEQERANGRRP